MFDSLSAHLLEVKPIKLGYLNTNRNFMGDFTLSGTEDYFTTQNELSGVIDFKINYDSVNFLTDVRDKFSTITTQSKLEVYGENLPEHLCGDLKDNCANYWVTLPVDLLSGTDDYCYGSVNIIPLKNNFGEEHQTLCAPCYKKYNTLNFGFGGLDNFKPELLYTTHVDNVFFGKERKSFKFKIPDWSDPISALDGNDFLCYGSLASDCSLYSDSIEWYLSGENNPTLITTWLSGNTCDATWVDSYYQDGIFTDVSPSEITLLSGVEYTYIRPSALSDEEIKLTITNSNDIIFSLDCVSGDTIVDASPNNIDGTFI